MKYYISQNGQPAGPYEPQELLQQGLTINSQVWNETMAGWQSAGQVPELATLLGSNMMPQMPPQPAAPAYPQYQQTQQPQYGGAYVQPQYAQQQPYQQPMGVMPDTHMVGAILVTLFCCLPFGIIAIVKASNVSSCYNRGDYNGAVNASNEASKWIKWSIIGAIVGTLLYVLFVVVLGFGGALAGGAFD